MSVGKIRGIVIGEAQRGESSKQITVLAKGVGKVRLSARGAKNAKSHLLAGTQLLPTVILPFTRGEVFGR